MKVANVSTAQLEYLLAALATDSWKEAAESVGVTPSALSQGISELERRLGVTLFDKQGRRRVATATGQEAGAHATRVLAELRELSRWADEIKSGGTGQLSIGMIDTAAIHHYGDTLMRFRATRPDITLRLIVQPSGTLLELLAAGDVDAVIVVDPAATDRFDLRPLLVEPLYAYAPPGTKVGPPTTWGPWVGFPAASRTRALIARSLRRQSVSYDVVAESSQPAVLREMVHLGMGWCVLPATDAEAEPHALKRATREPIAERTLTLVRRTDRTPSPALTALLDELQ